MYQLRVKMQKAVYMGLLFVGVASLVSGQPRPCCFDNQYSVDIGIVGESLSSSPNSSPFIDGSIRFGFDYYRDRLGMLQRFNLFNGSYSTLYSLKDYATRRQHTTQDNFTTCTYTDIPSYDVMRPACIPEDARYVGPSQFGYGHNTLMMNMWQFTYPLSANNESGVFLSVSQDHCVPIVESIIGNIEGYQVEESLFYVNYHPGLEDFQNLDIPSNCQPASTS